VDHVLQELQAALPERYTLEREIARTAMSRVYRARERHPDRAVVVKALEISVTAHLARERFV
jgi:serine/threonine protein kinase